jgi:hypothetical protein
VTVDLTGPQSTSGQEEGRGALSQRLKRTALQLSDVLREEFLRQAGLFNAVHAANESM